MAGFLALSSSLAVAGPLAGNWHQIQSNAGACPTCKVSISENGSLATVTGSNGWSAGLSWQNADGTSALGRGQWSPGRGGRFGGKEIEVGASLEGDTLTLTMTVVDGSIKGKIVAKYGRDVKAGLLFDAPAQAPAQADATPGIDTSDQVHNGVRRYSCNEGIPLIATFVEDALFADISIDGSPIVRLRETGQNAYGNKQYALTIRGRVATLRSSTGTDKCQQD